MKQRTPIIIVLALVGAAMMMVSSVRRHLFHDEKRVKNRHDVYFLPPPEQVVRMSLGYRHAFADVLWAHVLVSQGLHNVERRRFENLVRLYDAINELAPKWRSPYLLADALITFQANETPFEEVVKVREILERGTKERPTDAGIWLNLGQFVSFVAPASYLEDDHPDVAKRWRLEGVPYLARAAELGAENANVSWQALGGAVILAKAGQRDAAIAFYERTYKVTDDEELKKDIMRRLSALMQERDLESLRQREKTFIETFLGRLPIVNPVRERDAAITLGPPPMPARCAGPGHEDKIECATNWKQWAAHFESR